MYKVISLFSGCGGSSLGYKKAGFKLLAAVEFVDFQAEAYRQNNKKTKVYEADIRTLDPKKIMSELGIKKGDLDILDGSPPCSSFSMAGNREKDWGKVRKYSNTKQRTDDLFDEYIRFIEGIKPKVFVAENVRGMVLGSAKGYFKKVFLKMERLGYNVKAKVLNSKFYGVPQSRERLIFIGVRKDLKLEPVYPERLKKIISVKEAWRNLPAKNKKLSDEQIDIESKYAYIKILKKMRKKPNRVISGSSYTGGSYFNLTRLSYDMPSDTICQQSGELSNAGNCHPEHDRKLTIPELRRIQTIPDEYNLIGSTYRQWESIARTVPPEMMYNIAKTIKKEILDKVTKE